MHTNSDRTILVPVLSTKQTLHALIQSYELAQLTKSKLILLGVETTRHPFNKQKFDSIVNDARTNSGVQVETMVRDGHIFDEITKVADILNPLFIVIGISGKLSPTKLIGRNAFKLVRDSHHNVITVGGDRKLRTGFDKILLPIDLDRESREKVQRAVVFAKMFNSEIHIISITDHEDKLEDMKLKAYAEQAEKYIKKQGIVCSTHTLLGDEDDIPETILNYGHTVDADLIIITSRDDLSFKEYILGTTAQKLINESDLPVLSFRPLEHKDTTIGVKPY